LMSIEAELESRRVARLRLGERRTA
jgi:hypothetical protein